MSFEIYPFTDFDISVIKSILEREPNERELRFIGSTLKPLLDRRYFIDFYSNISFKKAVKGQIIDKNIGLYWDISAIDETQIIELLIRNEIFNRKIFCIGIHTQKKDSISKIKKILYEWNNLIKFQNVSIVTNQNFSNSNENGFLFSLASKANKAISNNSISSDSSIYIIKNKSTSKTKNIKDIFRLIQKIKMNSNYFILPTQSKYPLIFSILTEIMDKNIGIDFHLKNKSEINDILFQLSKSAVIIFGNKGIYQKIKMFKPTQFSVSKLGNLNTQDNLSLYIRDSQKLSLPKNIFSFLWQTQNTILSIEEKKKKNDDKIDIKKENSYNKKLIAVIKELNRNIKISFNHKNNLIEKLKLKQSINLKDEYNHRTWILGFSEYDQFASIDPSTAGKISISNAVRDLRCKGLKPYGILVQNYFSADPKAIRDSATLIQSQEIAIRHFNLQSIYKNINFSSSQISQNIYMVGNLSEKSICPASGFKQAGQFISILGSHRGELTGSVFQKCFPKYVDSSTAQIDLNMESKLGEVLELGIKNHLIQTATNVGRGGLSAALISNLIFGSSEMGARINLSRKLKSEELLFGETHGLVVISLQEEDIMEFERICMNIGVPCTTIGRVTNDGKFRFNKLIDISTKELKDIYD